MFFVYFLKIFMHALSFLQSHLLNRCYFYPNVGIDMGIKSISLTSNDPTNHYVKRKTIGGRQREENI